MIKFTIGRRQSLKPEQLTKLHEVLQAKPIGSPMFNEQATIDSQILLDKTLEIKIAVIKYLAWS
jgi:hypothetical protein